MVYGGGSIKKTVLYAQRRELLRDFEVFELSGIDPSPRITSVNAGRRLCREHKIDMVLDCCKLICDAALYAGDACDLVTEPSKITKALPLFAVLTLAATGSDFNCGAGITSPKPREKRDVIVPLQLSSGLGARSGADHDGEQTADCRRLCRHHLACAGAVFSGREFHVH